MRLLVSVRWLALIRQDQVLITVVGWLLHYKIYYQHLLQRKMSFAGNLIFLVLPEVTFWNQTLCFWFSFASNWQEKKNKIIVSSKKITFSAEKLKCFKNIHFLVTDILNFHSDLWKNSQRGNHLCLKSVSFWPTLHLNNVTKKIVQRWYSWLNPSAHKHFQCSEIKTTSVFT